ncbi:MAG TPA: LOG family protein [bacterium]|nr:LOG family protein [bacterium]
MPERCVTVFGSSKATAEDPIYAAGLRLGRLLVESGYVVRTGGYTGLMEAVSRGAAEAGGKVVGVTMTPWGSRLRVNPWVSEEIAAEDLFQRLRRLIDSEAYVALPGGLGTLGEVVVTWNLFQTATIPRRPLILVGSSWQAVIEGLRAGVRIEPRDLELVRVIDTVDGVIPLLEEARAP